MQSVPSFLRIRSRAAQILALTLAMLLAGCGKDEKKNPVSPGGGGTPATTSFAALIADGTNNGRLTVTVSTTSLARGLHASGAASVTATGSLDFSNASPIALSGTYDDAADTLNLTGGGYTLHGIVAASAVPPGLAGSYEGPNGPGVFSGSQGSLGGNKMFCGTYSSLNNPNVHGTFTMVIIGAEITGVGVDSGGDVVAFSGTVYDDTATTKILEMSDESGALLINGTWHTDTDMVDGGWGISGDAYDGGNWSGGACQ